MSLGLLHIDLVQERRYARERRNMTAGLSRYDSHMFIYLLTYQSDKFDTGCSETL